MMYIIGRLSLIWALGLVDAYEHMSNIKTPYFYTLCGSYVIQMYIAPILQKCQ